MIILHIAEKEVRRIVSIHFREKYHLDVDPNRMEWDMYKDFETGLTMNGLEVDDRGALSYLYQESKNTK